MSKKILEQLKAIKKLAERGIGGEKENAKRKYAELIKKYNISESEITEEKEYRILLGKKMNIYSQIKRMVVVTVVGEENETTYINRFSGYFTQFKTTEEIYKMIREMIQIFFFEYKKSLKIFNHAFFIKQGLVVYLDKNEMKKLSKEEIEKMAKAQKMAKGIDKKEYYKKIEK